MHHRKYIVSIKQCVVYSECTGVFIIIYTPLKIDSCSIGVSFIVNAQYTINYTLWTLFCFSIGAWIIQNRPVHKHGYDAPFKMSVYFKRCVMMNGMHRGVIVYRHTTLKRHRAFTVRCIQWGTPVR
jgi:hypothetical protein